MTVDYSYEALEDLADIALYTSIAWSDEQTHKYLLRLSDGIDAIAEGQVQGKIVKNAPTYCLRRQVEEHMVIYRIDELEQALTVIRILHKSMDYLDHLQ